MKEKLKAFLEKIGILKVIQFFKYDFKKVLRRGVSKIGKFYYFRMVLPAAYNKERKKPIEEDKVLFIEVRLSQVTNSFEVIYDELLSNYDFNIHFHYLLEGSVTKGEYLDRCKDMLKDLATAKYVFINDSSNVLSCIKKRKETFVCQLWHGCGAFKKFGFATADLLFGESRKELLKYPYYRNQDYVTVSSPEVEWAYTEAMNLEDYNGKAEGIGISRTDIFYNEDFKKAAFDKLYRMFPAAKGKKVILYAPTFRGRVAKAVTPPMLRVSMFKEAFYGEYVMIMKHHPFVKHPPIIDAEYDDFARDFTSAMSIEELLCVSDVCISDYSSLVFEYSLFERPLIFFSFDLSEYCDWRGFFYNYDELAPGPVFTTNKEVIDYIKNIDTAFDRQKIIDFRNKFMSGCDGHATERIMEKTFGKEVLEKYKKKTPMPGEYHKIESNLTRYALTDMRLGHIEWLKEKGNELYKGFAKEPVVKNKVVILQGNKGADESKYFENHAKKKDFTVVNLSVKGIETDSKAVKRYKKMIKEIATAAFIYMMNPSDMINALDIRKETKLIMASADVMPLERQTYDRLDVKAGLLKEFEKRAPLHGDYDLVPVAGDELKETYKNGFGIKKEKAVRSMGAIGTDVLFSKGFVDKAKEKLYGLFPEAKDKKVIFYYPEMRTFKKKPDNPVFIDFALMYEYLKDDYCVIFKRDFEKNENALKYEASFIRNVTQEMTDNECMAACDIMIGDYRPMIYTFAALDKPIILYTPDLNWYFDGKDLWFNYRENLPGMLCTKVMDVIKLLEKMSDYDDTNQKQFKERFLSGCDGKTTSRLINYMIKSQEEKNE